MQFLFKTAKLTLANKLVFSFPNILNMLNRANKTNASSTLVYKERTNQDAKINFIYYII